MTNIRANAKPVLMVLEVGFIEACLVGRKLVLKHGFRKCQVGGMKEGVGQEEEKS